MLKRFLCGISAILILSAASCKKSKQTGPAPYVPPPTVDPRVSLSFTQLSRLRADGKKVVNAQNQEAVLRGVGLGYWLLQEGYMLGDASKAKNQWSMKKIYYDAGLSDSAVEAFYQKWRDNFITYDDIFYMKSLGFNSIRLPMHYELFLTDSQRTVRNSVIHDPTKLQNYTQSLADWKDQGKLFQDYNLEGFRIIDKILQWCGANNMYVILDLHAAPGGQGADVNISDALAPNYFWNGRDNQARPVYQDVTLLLWDKISKHYKDDDRIAWYDLLNEPNSVPNPSWTRDIQEKLIDVVRANNDTHLLMVEGNDYGNNYNGMMPSNFTQPTNLIYSAHRYWISDQDDITPDANANSINRLANLLAFRNANNVPVWVGETGENTNDWLKQNITKLEAQNIGWCHWTYKRHDVNANAALMRLGGRYPTDGVIAMNEVLENIKFYKSIANPQTVQAVAPALR